MESQEPQFVNPRIMQALEQGRILWKDALFRLTGLHTAWIVWCASDTCPHYEIIWVAEDQEMPVGIAVAEKLLYERGWAKYDGHWLCLGCFEEKVAQDAQK